MKILICGASGQVGQRLSLYLSKKHIVYATYKSNKLEKRANLFPIKVDFNKKISKLPKFDMIINCIATHQFSDNNKKINFYRSHVLSIKNLISYCNKNKPILIINLSTISVKDALNKKSNNFLLGLTKFEGENLFNNSGMNCLNLRLPGIIGGSKDLDKRPWLNVINKKLKSHSPIKIKNHNYKFNYVIDVYEIFKFIDHLIKNKIYKTGTYNFSASYPLKIISLIKLMKKINFSKSIISFEYSNSEPPIICNTIRKNFNFRISNVKEIILRNYC